MDIILKELRNIIQEKGLMTFSEHFSLYDHINFNENVSLHDKYKTIMENLEKYSTNNKYIPISFLKKLNEEMKSVKAIYPSTVLDNYINDLNTVIYRHKYKKDSK
jgi:hypothetical protein